MLIRITNDEGDYVEARIDDHSDINDVADCLKGLLVAHGYHPNNLDDMFTKERWNDEKD